MNPHNDVHQRVPNPASINTHIFLLVASNFFVQGVKIKKASAQGDATAEAGLRDVLGWDLVCPAVYSKHQVAPNASSGTCNLVKAVDLDVNGKDAERSICAMSL